MRILDPVIEDAFNNGQLSALMLVHIKWPTGDVYLHTGVGPQLWNSQTWTGVGSLGDIDKIKEGEKSGRLTLSITTSDNAQIAEVLQDDCVGSEVRIYIAAVSDKQRIYAAQLMYFGYINDVPLQYSNPPVISVECVGVEHRWNLPKQNSRYTSADQRADYPTDNFFDDVEAISKGPLSSYDGAESVGGKWSDRGSKL
jgi:hypothetical protein